MAEGHSTVRLSLVTEPGEGNPRIKRMDTGYYLIYQTADWRELVKAGLAPESWFTQPPIYAMRKGKRIEIRRRRFEHGDRGVMIQTHKDSRRVIVWFTRTEREGEAYDRKMKAEQEAKERAEQDAADAQKTAHEWRDSIIKMPLCASLVGVDILEAGRYWRISKAEGERLRRMLRAVYAEFRKVEPIRAGDAEPPRLRMVARATDC